MRTKAILRLYSSAVTVRGDGESAYDEAGNSITLNENDVVAEVARLQAEYDGLEYSRTRANEYPPIGDQLDALWKGGDDAAAMKVIVDKVKSDNPKG
jgi:hypothetical protein